MAVVIRVVELTGSTEMTQLMDPAGLYVQDYDPDAFDGRGDAQLTAEIDEAKRFDDFMAAHKFWSQPSTTHPVRADGRPNRPLTVFTVEFKNVQ